MATHGVDEGASTLPALRTWRKLTSSAIQSAKATNRAMLAPIKASAAVAEHVVDEGSVEPPSMPSIAYEDEFWAFDRTVEHVDDINVGDVVRFTKRITAEDVSGFAEISGDTNRLHLDEEFARTTRFGTRIVHGTLVSGMISAALARLPGLTIYLSQDLEFLGPVEIGERITAVVEVVEELGDGRYRLTTTIENEAGELVIDGEAIVLVDPIDEAEG